jgi:hypothetical protein
MDKRETPPEDYIASLSPDRRPEIRQLDALITSVLAEQPRTMWEGTLWGGTDQNIIGYGEHSYQRSDGNTVDWFMVGLTAQKTYISIYVNATDSDGYITQRWADKLGKTRIGASSVSFKSVEDINLDALAAMIAEAGKLSG